MTEREKRKEEKGVPGWLEFYDLSLHTDVEAVIPKEPYIRGTVISGMVGLDRRFEPGELTILGEPMELPSEIGGTPGWVELRTVQFYGDMVARKPISPYVHGFMDEKNHFYPDEPFMVIDE